MEYDVNRIEFVKIQMRKQMSKHIFQISIDSTVHNHILKLFFHYILTCSACSELYLLCCFAFAELKCFCASTTVMCLLPNTLYCNGFLQMKTQVNMKLLMNYLQKDN